MELWNMSEVPAKGGCRAISGRGPPKLAWLVGKYSFSKTSFSFTNTTSYVFGLEMKICLLSDLAFSLGEKSIHKNCLCTLYFSSTVTRTDLTFSGANIPRNIPGNDAGRQLAPPQ